MALKDLTPHIPNPSGIIDRRRFDYIDGGAAGNHTLTGIRAPVDSYRPDAILKVTQINLTLTDGAPNVTLLWSPADITSEFTISADDTINNTGGTVTTGDLLIIEWYDGDYGHIVNLQGAVD